MSTLDYAHRAKNIKNQPTVNQKMTKKVHGKRILFSLWRCNPLTLPLPLLLQVVLKEYCAEIESLKNQLQLTREKNGVYVDPNEFYSMEARLSTQEAQIAECEAALRARNEEVKSLRVGFDEATAKYEAAQKEVRKAQHSLTLNLHP